MNELTAQELAPGDFFEEVSCGYTHPRSGRHFPLHYEQRQILEIDGQWALVLHPPKPRHHGTSRRQSVSQARYWQKVDSIIWHSARAREHREGKPCDRCDPAPQESPTKDSPAT